jgi:hypothetical protein
MKSSVSSLMIGTFMQLKRWHSNLGLSHPVAFAKCAMLA